MKKALRHNLVRGLYSESASLPPAWNTRICSLYNLDEQQQTEFSAAVANALEMNFNGVSLSNRELAVSFARKFAEFDEEQLASIRKILEEDRK